MKVEISIGNRQVAFLIAFVGVLVALGMAGAYDNPPLGGNAALMGHSSDEIMVNIPGSGQMPLQQAFDSLKNAKIYDSGWFYASTVAPNTGLYTKEHGLGAVPDVVQLWYSDMADGSGDVVLLGGSPTSGVNGATIIDVDQYTVSVMGKTYIADYSDKAGTRNSPTTGWLKIVAIKWS